MRLLRQLTRRKLRTTLTQDVATRVKARHPRPLLPRPRRLVRRLLRRPDPMKLTVRRGWLWEEDEAKCYSVLLENPLSSPTVQVDRLYFDTEQPLSLLREPIRLGPGGHWETAVPADSIPPASRDVRRLVKAEHAKSIVHVGWKSRALSEQVEDPELARHPRVP